MRRPPTRYRLRVNPVACDGFGYCGELAPELVSLDEWGYPVLPDGVVPTALLDVAEAAVRECPRRALFLQAVAAQEGPPDHLKRDTSRR